MVETEGKPAMTGAELKAWRHEMGITQKTAARELGVAWRTLVGWERGEYPVPLAISLACSWLDALRELEG